MVKDKPMQKLSAVLFLLLLTLLPIPSNLNAQEDGLNLPTELYILLNAGTIERYGLGVAGVEQVTPDTEFVLDFAVAPDGNWLAYRTESGITLTEMLVESPNTVQLEGTSADVPPVRGRGATMAWSPDGAALAYSTTGGLRAAFNVDETPAFTHVPVTAILSLQWSASGTYLAVEVEDYIWWIYRVEGTQFILASAIPTSYGLAWLDDARLIFAPAEGGLRLMDLANGNAQSLLQDETRAYRLPYVRANNVVAAFSRPINETEGDTWFLTTLQADGTLINISENPVEIMGGNWAPEGRLLVRFTSGILVLVEPSSGAGFPLPVASTVAYGWGGQRPDGATGISTSFEGYFRAPTADGIVQVWRLPTNGLPPLPLTSAERDITEYAISRRGDNVAYVSDGELWLQPITSTGQQGEAQLLAEIEARDLAFNAAGDLIAFVTFSSPNDPRSGLWTISTAGGDPELILENEAEDSTPVFVYVNPQYAPNFNALLLERQTTQSVEAALYDPASGEITELGEFERVRWLANGRIMGAVSGSEPGSSELYILDPQIRPLQPALVFRAGSAEIIDMAELGGSTFRALLRGQNQPGQTFLTLEEVNTQSGESATIAEVNYMVEPRLSADGAFVAGYIQPDGSLMVYSINQDAHVILSAPSSVLDFRWRDF